MEPPSELGRDSNHLDCNEWCCEGSAIVVLCQGRQTDGALMFLGTSRSGVRTNEERMESRKNHATDSDVTTGDKKEKQAAISKLLPMFFLYQS